MLISSHALSLSSPLSFPTSIPARFVHEAMRDRRMDRFIVLPFSIGCVSQSSVSVTKNQPKKAQAEAAAAPTLPGCGDDQRQGSRKRVNISAGFQKLVKSFKNLSQLFVIYEDEDDDAEIEMEIGFPTDVQHIGHIGWDGFNSVNNVKSWDKAPEFVVPLPSFSLKQFELAMAAQSGGAPPAPVPLGTFR